jgi:transcriptional regulator with XRE-family HTH domain
MNPKRLEKIKYEFGIKVKEIRLRQDLTQLDLAAKIGTDVRQIKRIENGETTTSLVMVYLISQALEVSTEELFDFKV